MGGIQKKGPKHKKPKEKVKEVSNELSEEDLKFKRMMEEGNVYKKVHGATRRVR